MRIGNFISNEKCKTCAIWTRFFYLRLIRMHSQITIFACKRIGNDIGCHSVHMQWIYTRTLPSTAACRRFGARVRITHDYCLSCLLQRMPRLCDLFAVFFTLQFVSRWEPKPLNPITRQSYAGENRSWIQFEMDLQIYWNWFLFFFSSFRFFFQTKRPTNRINRQPNHGGGHTWRHQVPTSQSTLAISFRPHTV